MCLERVHHIMKKDSNRGPHLPLNYGIISKNDKAAGATFHMYMVELESNVKVKYT